MHHRPNKIFWWVFGVHTSALFLLLVIPMFKSCTHRKPDEVIVETMIISEAPVTVAAPQPAPEPTPQPAPQPAPAPKPEPKPAPVPEPKKPVIKAPVPEKTVPAPEPEKPKWKPAEVIPQNKRVMNPNATPAPQPAAQPTPDLSALKKVLNSTASSSPSDAYYGIIKPRFYTIWQQPAGAPYGTQATATIRVGADGAILFRALTTPSGNSAFDQSVRAAINAVSRLPAPPDSLINRDIRIYFQTR